MKYNWAVIILIFILPLLVFLLSIRLVAFDIGFYRSEFKRYNVYSEVENADELAENLLYYFQGFQGKTELDVQYFSTRELLHLKDVRNIFVFWNRAFYLLLFTSLILILYLVYTKEYSSIASALFIGSLLTVALLVAIGLIAVIRFEWLFVNFHALFFENDFWLLSVESTLIKLFPAEFFYDAFLRIMLYSAGFALGVVLICWVALNRIARLEPLKLYI